MKYCKHSVDRTGGKYVSKHGCKNVSMYAYKRGAGKDGTWMDGSVWASDQRATGDHWGEAVSERQRAETHQQGEPPRTSGQQDRK